MGRETFTFECTVCAGRNYRTARNFVVGAPKIERSKFCPTCRKHTTHKERKK
ncbi:MAG: 50S ribosomal protein L33 [Planctomycetota bacterium]